MADYQGCLHLHTTYSDGGTGMDEVVRAAQAAGLDFVIVNDHDTLAARDQGWEGWHDGVLVVIGVEVTPRKHGHILALGAHEVDGYRRQPHDEFLPKLRRQGALSFAAHPAGTAKLQYGVKVAGWNDWHHDALDGIELWSYLHDWIGNARLTRLWHAYQNPDDYVHGPPPEVLARWDDVCQSRRLVALGGLDNHARKMCIFRRGIFPHEEAFRTVRTHVLCDEWSGDAEQDIAQLYDTLAGGRAYVSYDLLGDPRGFDFRVSNTTEWWPMGAEFAYNVGCTLKVTLPGSGQARVLRNGTQQAAFEDQNWSSELIEPGVYRVEVKRQGRPWIFSNPIYVRP